MWILDIVGWELFLYFSHLFIIQPIISGDTGVVDFFGRCQNSHPMFSLFLCHRLNIDRCMIKASDHDILDFTLKLKQTCYDLMTDSERYVVKLINLCVLNK